MKTVTKSLGSRIIVIILILSLMLPHVVYAGTSSTSGGVGDASCTASKTITQGGSSWTAYVKSQCDLGIGVIGYTWWTVRQYCAPTGKYTTKFQSPFGDVNYNSNSFQRSFAGIAYASCSSSIQLQDWGRHDFQSVSSTWQPTVNRNELHY